MTRNQVVGGIVLICLVGVALYFGSGVAIDAETSDAESNGTISQSHVDNKADQHVDSAAPETAPSVPRPGSVGGEPLRPEYYSLEETLEWLRKSGVPERGLQDIAQMIVVPDPLTKLQCVESERGTCEEVIGIQKSLPHPYYDYPLETLEGLAFSDAAAAQIAAEKLFAQNDYESAVELAFRGSIISGKAGPLIKIRELLADASGSSAFTVADDSTATAERRQLLDEAYNNIIEYSYALEVLSNDFLPEHLQIEPAGLLGKLSSDQRRQALELVAEFRGSKNQVLNEIGQEVQG